MGQEPKGSRIETKKIDHDRPVLRIYDRLPSQRPALIHSFLEFRQLTLGGTNLFRVFRCILAAPILQQFDGGPIDLVPVGGLFETRWRAWFGFCLTLHGHKFLFNPTNERQRATDTKFQRSMVSSLDGGRKTDAMYCGPLRGLQRIRTQSSAWSLTRYAVPMTPEQARFLLDFTLPTLKQETATTAKVIAATPNAKLDYRPSERCMTAAELMWHIASADVMFLEGILSGTFGKGPEKPDNVHSPEQISAWYKERMSATIEKLSAYTPEDAARILDVFGFLHAPAAGVITFAVSHSIHHRGQLSSYIRPMGGKVPSIYGPSGDENPFAKAEGQ